MRQDQDLLEAYFLIMHPRPILLLTLAAAVFGAPSRLDDDKNSTPGSRSLTNKRGLANARLARDPLIRRGLAIEANVLGLTHDPTETADTASPDGGLDITANVLAPGKPPVEVTVGSGQQPADSQPNVLDLTHDSTDTANTASPDGGLDITANVLTPGKPLVDVTVGSGQQPAADCVTDSSVDGGDSGGLHVDATIGRRKKRLDVTLDVGLTHRPIEVTIGKRLDVTAELLKSEQKPVDIEVTKRLDVTAELLKSGDKPVDIEVTKRLDVTAELLKSGEKPVDIEVTKRLDVTAELLKSGEKPVDIEVTKRLDVTAELLKSGEKPVDIEVTKRLDVTAELLKSGEKPVDIEVTKRLDVTAELLKSGDKPVDIEVTKRLDVTAELLKSGEKPVDIEVTKRLDVTAELLKSGEKPVDIEATKREDEDEEVVEGEDFTKRFDEDEEYWWADEEEDGQSSELFRRVDTDANVQSSDPADVAARVSKRSSSSSEDEDEEDHDDKHRNLSENKDDKKSEQSNEQSRVENKKQTSSGSLNTQGILAALGPIGLAISALCGP
ncbi:hypothetical protein DFQ26_003652 [Actinomortierella ambigua]|nr:hypothetical protein DFQ26_003652 [Actinomortierella ambigua]